MSKKKRELLGVRSGILIFILILVGAVYAPVSYLPDIEVGRLTAALLGGILPAVPLFVALGFECATEDQRFRL